MRARSKALATLALITAGASVAAADARRIDGTTDAAFAESLRAIEASLDDLTRMRLALAQIRIIAIEFSACEEARDRTEIRPCDPVAYRKSLHGMSADEIISRASALPGGLSVGFVEEPSNKALERTDDDKVPGEKR